MIIKCIECGGMVSDKAKACPHCGAPMRSGVIGMFAKLLNWVEEQREAYRIRNLRAIENLRQIEDEERKRKAREEKIAYERSFSYASKPYQDSALATLDCASIRKQLCDAHSFCDIELALRAFPSLDFGYGVNKTWLKEWARINPLRRKVNVLYVAFCLKDHQLCDSLIKQDTLLSFEMGAQALVKLQSGCLDDTSHAFLQRYVDMSSSAKEYYQKEIKWLPIVDTNDDGVIEFYYKLGLEPKIGDQDLNLVRHGHLSVMGRRGVGQYWYQSALSNALDADDLHRIQHLLRWGANPNQWLFHCISSDASDDDKGSFSDPALLHVRSVEAFELMCNAGMLWYPVDKSGGMEYNLVEHLWRGDKLEGKRLELLEYLYKIRYDQRLVNEVEHFRIALRNGNYRNNQETVMGWILENSNQSK